MRKFINSRWFIISILCLGTLIVYGSLSLKSKQNRDNKATNRVATEIQATTEDIENHQIYGTFKSEASWATDPTEPKNLLEITENNAILKVKVKSIGEALFLESTEDFNDPNPYTPIEVIVKNSLYGEKLDKINTIYLKGGHIKIYDLMKKLDQDTIEKMVIDTLSEEDQKTMYVSYETDYDYSLKPNEEYVLIVAKNPNNIYTVVANGYGIFKEEKPSTNLKAATPKIQIKNVLTDKNLTDSKGKELSIKK